jgi:soluble cytochrome b562
MIHTEKGGIIMAEISMQAMNTYTNNNRPVTFQANQASREDYLNAKNDIKAKIEDMKAAATGKKEETKSPTEQAAEKAKDNFEKASDITKTDTEKANNILKTMKDVVYKLSNLKEPTGEDQAIMEKELKGLQEELGKFVGGYNDALRLAQSSTNANALSSGAGMVTRTANIKDTLKQIGVNIEDNNELSQKVNELAKNQEEIGNAFKAYESLFKGDYSYGRKTVGTIESLLGA